MKIWTSFRNPTLREQICGSSSQVFHGEQVMQRVAVYPEQILSKRSDKGTGRMLEEAAMTDSSRQDVYISGVAFSPFVFNA